MNSQHRQRQGMQSSIAGSSTSQPQTPRFQQLQQQRQQIPFYQEPQHGEIDAEDNSSFRHTPTQRQSTRRPINVPSLSLNPNPNISPDISPRIQFQTQASPRKSTQVRQSSSQQDVTPQISPRRANVQQFNLPASPSNTSNSVNRSVNFSPNHQVQHFDGVEDEEGYSEFSHEDYIGDEGTSSPSANPIMYVPDGQSQGQGKGKGLGINQGQAQVYGQQGLGKPQGQVGQGKAQGTMPVTKSMSIANRPMGIMSNQSAAETNQYNMPPSALALSPRGRPNGQNVGMAPQSPTQKMSMASQSPTHKMSIASQQQQMRMHAPMQTQATMSQHRAKSMVNRSVSISPPRRSIEQQQSAAFQGAQPGSPPQLNRYLSTAGPRVSVIASSSFQAQQPFPVRTSVKPALTSMASTSRPNDGSTKNGYHLSVIEVILRLVIAIACAVAFCVMVTNTVWINNEAMSYSVIGGFRYLAGVTATSFIFCLIQLGAMLSRKLKSQTTGLEVKPSKTWMIFSMLLDQVFAYLILSAGSAAVSALIYIPELCHSQTVALTVFCHRSTLSVVLTIIGFVVYIVTSVVSSYRLYKKHFQSA